MKKMKETIFFSDDSRDIYPVLMTYEDIKKFYNRYSEEFAQKVLDRNVITPEDLELLKENGEMLYCTLPFLNINLTANGIKCCTWLCEMDGVNIVPLEAGNDLVKAWKSNALERVRKSIRDGSYKHCLIKSCPVVRGERKNLKTLKEIQSKFPDIADYLEGKVTQYLGMPSFGHISIDTTCNLMCPSCSRFHLPNISSKNKSEIMNSLKTVNQNIKIIYLAGMGEPFFSPGYLDWMMNFRSSDYPLLEEICINTNGQKLTSRLWQKLPDELKKYISSIIVSIDGATAMSYEENRPGGSFKTLLENLAFLKELRDSGGIKHLRAYFVYQLNNYRDMPKMIELSNQFSFDLIFFARLMNWGSYKPKKYKQLDIGSVEHPDHSSFEEIIELINNYKKVHSKPEIILMR